MVGPRTALTHCRMCYASGKMESNNKLYFGDNLSILREHVPEGIRRQMNAPTTITTYSKEGATCELLT
jgi:hypothetical protein